jgi:Tetratricopeptide repeat
MSIFDRFRTDRTFADGQRALDRGDLDEAIATFERYVRADDQNPAAWFNLGLAYKLMRDWPNSVRCNRQAAQLEPSNQEAHWNMGVAATALRDWATARAAWRGIGLDPPPGAGPPEFDNLGPTPVRLNPGDGAGTETVWGARIDPCRVRIESVPLPESGHRWHDIVLHDVVPNGTRQAGGQTWSVFDELIRMDPSDAPTFESQLTVPIEEDGQALTELLADLDVGVEDWSESVQLICAQCDVSSVHEHAAANDVTPIRMVVRRYGFGGDAAVIGAALERWAASGTGRVFEPLSQVS